MVLPFFVHAQSVNVPVNSDYYHLVDRYEIKSGQITPSFFSSWRAYQRSQIAEFADTISTMGNLSSVDRFNLNYLKNDNWEWTEGADNESKKPILKHFYKVKSDLYHVRTKDFDLHINPVLHLGGGTESGSDVNTFINTRGVEVRGMIDNKVGFYSFLGETQTTLPLYVREGIEDQLVVPQEGFWKGFNENGVDFFTARGYISFQATKHINLQFGHDRFKIGNGYRSLILSDFSPAYLFLKTNTKIWKFNYTNLFTQMTADVEGNPTGLTGSSEYPNKYMALHHLSINIGKKLNVGVFESVIFSREDSLGNNYQLRYLNPIVFYRAIEQQNGSSDNVIIGLDFKWHVAKGVMLYGQLALDEFLLENVREGNGWWANKNAFQLGAEYVDAFGISNLDLQLEGNTARPYTYSHDTQFGSYSNYRQPLAHPLGANFREVVAIARYQPIDRLNVTAKLIYSNYGEDVSGAADSLNTNFGTNILLSNTTREMDFGNETTQGIDTQVLFGDLTLSYQWRHNLFIDLKHTYRNLESAVEANNRTTNHTSVAIRWNIPQRLNEF